MDVIPEELVDRILQYIADDPDSLQACALTSPLLHEPSHRLLLHAVALGGSSESRNLYQTLGDAVDASPHIARCIRMVAFTVPSTEMVLTQTAHLHSLMAKFTHLRHFMITSDEEDFDWTRIAPGITDELAQFLRCRTLDALHVSCIVGIPLDFVALTMSSALTVSFVETSVNDGEMQLNQQPVAENLLLSSSQTVADAFCRADLIPCISRLRRLWVGLEPTLHHIIESSAPMLEEIFMGSTDLISVSHFGHPGPLPDFPSLRLATIQLCIGEYEQPWLVHAMRALLASPAEVINLQILEAQLSTLEPALQALTAELTTRPDHSVFTPRIHWLLDLGVTEDGVLQEFSTAVGRALPQMYAAGRVTVGRYLGREDGLYWPSGRVVLATRVSSFIE
ncbi:hypothetical protein FB45DRAFT_1010509 [Roridomyces roridus]|uniref:F-box domain-containing protein n=1 Tax=Roridomyces roridus TaxID=1738132 RepID=A0AAD7B486_9AGAR|nr:hypothetical protein FB45DRAFT_1010509 [Roridomyces roridus]